MGEEGGSIALDDMECPLCLGEGHLKRTEVLDRPGVKDFARVAQLSAEEAFRLLLSKHKQDERDVWVRFEAELTKHTNLVAERHKDELRSLTARTKELRAAASVALQQKSHEIESANRRVEDSLREAGELRKRNYELESEMAKVAPTAAAGQRSCSPNGWRQQNGKFAGRKNLRGLTGRFSCRPRKLFFFLRSCSAWCSR
jgi:hypothetical protein